ncbi:protein FAM149B1-like [Oscarella lobularis]|uniref:protein FAM149B1-like n=1 Tax=Oscarella lobularis TaxID=121494 RepID=UPI0033131C9A
MTMRSATPRSADEIMADYLFACSAGSSSIESADAGVGGGVGGARTGVGGLGSSWSSSGANSISFSFARRRRTSRTRSGSLGWTSATESEYSWGDDEFDRQASVSVKEMFDEIDSALYEGNTHAISHQMPTEGECQVWRANFPHFRIVGVQLVDSYEGEGDDFLHFVSHYPPPLLRGGQGDGSGMLEDVTADEAGLMSPSMVDVSSLVVQGKQMKLKPFPRNREWDGETPEEVIASDGIFEEYIAFDSSEMDLCGGSSSRKKDLFRRRRQRRLGLPPVTPNACVKDSTISELFDRIWSDVLVQLRPLLDAFKEKLSFEGSATPTSTSRLDDVLSSALRSDATTTSLSRNFAPQSASQVRLRTSYGANMPTTGLSAVSSINDLQKVMTIRSFPLRQRQQGGLQQITGVDSRPGSREGTPLVSMRPDSNMRSGRLGGIFVSRISDQMINSSGVKPITPKILYRRGGAGPSLKPLERTRTPVMDDMEIVRGHKLYTGNERIGTPSTPSWGRNGTLPPIEHVYNRTESEYPSPSQRRHISSPKARVHFASRVDMGDAGISLNARGIGPEARPSTMHASRADTPVKMVLRRSSTPYANSLQSRLRLGGSSVGNVGLTRLASYRPARDVLSEEEDELDDSFVLWNTHVPYAANPTNPLNRRSKGTLR